MEKNKDTIFAIVRISDGKTMELFQSFDEAYNQLEWHYNEYLYRVEELWEFEAIEKDLEY